MASTPNNRRRTQRMNSMGSLPPDVFEGFLDDLLNSPSQDSADSISSPSNSWRLTNPVHIQMQENAKLPTFNMPVDRTNSAYTRRGGQRDVMMTDEDANSSNRQVNLAEKFLGSSSRSSFHAAYAQAGALRNPPGSSPAAAGRERSGSMNSASASIDPLDALAAQVEPTPLSEIRRAAQVSGAARHNPVFGYSSGFNNYASYSGGGRSYALPIPQRSSSPPQQRRPMIQGSSGPPIDANHPMADAVATAAAIASQNGQPQRPAGPYTAAQQQNSVESTRKRPPSVETQTMAPVSGAMARASQQKSQYGFGPKHRVPSVPSPPEVHQAAANKKRRKDDPSPIPSTIHARPSSSDRQQQTSSPNSHNQDSQTTGAAYERKKQRAKVARVKLNESIERLNLAINLAGTQSKQRREQWLKLPAPVSSNSRAAMIKIMSDCVQTAEGAKKWDRPSFVGSAAALIQTLNAQCEALMRELAAVHENAGATSLNGVSSDKKRKANGAESPGGNGQKKTKDGGDAIDLTRMPTPALPETDGTIFGEKDVMFRIAGYLDQASLVRCTGVSKAWKHLFSRNDAWHNKAVERFGYYNARQWKEKLDDEDEGYNCSPLVIYRSMDAANVMPHYAHEGMFLLGEARIPGKLSAWCFLVERSNGETLRSVRRQESEPGSGTFTSLPIIELRTVIQNTGIHDQDVVIREQLQTVDASTRRRGVEMKEIDWDERFKKRVLTLDGMSVDCPGDRSSLEVCKALCRLKLYDAVVIETYIYAKGCSTTSKFVQRSNFTKLLVQIRDGMTVPLVIPFPRDASHYLEH